jgi:hypothetical protein
MYDEDYFTKAKNSPYINYPKSINGEFLVETQMKERTKLLIKKYGSKFSIIDWGCATGILVKMLRDKGVTAYGFDFADWAIEHKVCDYVYKEDALNMKENFKVNIVHSSDFLEHLPPERMEEILIKMSQRCKNEMCHYVPFYHEFDSPVSSPGDIHLCEVNADWWKKMFSKIPGFEIKEFPGKDGGYIIVKRNLVL